MKIIILSFILFSYSVSLKGQFSFSAKSGITVKNNDPSIGITNSVRASYSLLNNWSLNFVISLNNYLNEGRLSDRNQINTGYYGISDYRYSNPLELISFKGYYDDGIAIFKTKPNKFFHACYGLDLSRKLVHKSKQKLELDFGINFNRIDITKVINTFVPEYVKSPFGGTTEPILFLVFLHQSYLDIGIHSNLQYYYSLNSFLEIGANTNLTWLPKSKNVFLSSQISLRFSRK